MDFDMEIWMFIFAVLISDAKAFAQRMSRSRPENTVAFLGNNASFSCYLSPGSQDRHAWLFARATPTAGRDANETLSPIYHSHITITKDPHNYSISYLFINETLLEHAGTYACNGTPADGGIRSAELIILLSEPACSWKDSGGQILHSHALVDISSEVTCTLPYRGNWSPSMKWELHSEVETTVNQSDLGNFSQIRTNSQNKRVNSTVKMNSTSKNARNRRIYFTCTTNFSRRGRTQYIGESESPNIPDYTHAWTSPTVQLNVVEQTSSRVPEIITIGISSDVLLTTDQLPSDGTEVMMSTGISSAILVTTITAILVIVCVWRRRGNVCGYGRRYEVNKMQTNVDPGNVCGFERGPEVDKMQTDVDPDPGPISKNECIPIYDVIRSGRDINGKMEHDPYYNISADDQMEIYAEINSNASNPALNDIGSDLSNIKSNPGPATETEILSIYTEIESGGDMNEKIWRGDPDGYQLETRSSVLSIECYSSDRKSVAECELGNTRKSSIERYEKMPVYAEVKKQAKDVGFIDYENVEEFGSKEGMQCLEDPYYSSIDYTQLE